MMSRDVSIRGDLILLSVLFSLLAASLLGLSSCATVRPEWMDSYPKDSRYFIGIGSSNTGNRGEDMEIARAKAVAALASSISTTIQSEQTFTTRESSGDGSFESAEIIIRETVDQHLQAVEVYDSYYSEDEGYWFFLRLEKAVWARIEQEGKNRIIQRVFAVIEPVLAAPGVTVARKLTALGAGWDIVNQSPYAGLLETTIQGQQTTLIDFIENTIGSILEDIIIDSVTDGISVDSGSVLPLEISVYSESGGIPGKLPFFVTQKQQLYKKIVDFVTGPQGKYKGDVDTGSLIPGEHTFLVSLDLGNLGINPDRFLKKIIIPSIEIHVQVQRLKALIVTRVPDNSGVPGIDESAKAIVSQYLPFTLTSVQEEEPDYTVEFVLLLRDLPENDFGLFISYSKATISIIHKGATIYSYETGEFKDGGRDYVQAHQRASNALFQFLESDGLFALRMREALQFIHPPGAVIQ